MKWRPCLGDVRIVQSELDMAEVLLAEACAHDDTIKQLRDNEDFVVEYSKPSDRMPAKKAIAVSISYLITCACILLNSHVVLTKRASPHNS